MVLPPRHPNSILFYRNEPIDPSRLSVAVGAGIPKFLTHPM